MAMNTNGNNFFSVLGIIAGMVVMLCLFATLARKRTGGWYFTASHKVADTIMTRHPFRIFKSVLFSLSSNVFLAFRALTVTFLRRLKFICFCVFGISCFSALFASVVKAVLACRIFTELVNRLSFFTTRTRFGYNMFRHGLFPFKKVLFRAGYGCEPVVGSFYYSRNL